MQSPFTLKIQVVLLFWAAHGTQPEPQLQVVPGAFLAPGRKLGVCGASLHPRVLCWVLGPCWAQR